MAQKHALPRAWSPQLKRVIPERANTRRETLSDSAQIRSICVRTQTLKLESRSRCRHGQGTAFGAREPLQLIFGSLRV